MKTKLHIRQSLNAAVAILGIFLFNGILGTAQTTPTPAGASLNVADVNATMYADGISFMSPTANINYYTVPKTGNANSIFAAAMWIGGLDAGAHLHTAAGTYRQSGADFWPGPIMNKGSYSPHMDSLWNKVWSINKSTIDSFKRGLFTHIPASIASWPGNGNPAIGQASQLAPYEDSNHNGYYDPAGGDYPLIRGDQAVYMIFNDDRGNSHTETGGQELRIEVHLMAYAYNTPSDTAVYQTTFLHYDIFNYSAYTYKKVYLGYFCDMDLGNGGDDYVGSDSAHNFWYTYNGEATDPNGVGAFSFEPGYGGPTPPPPVQGVAYLCDTMSHFMYYNNDFSVAGNPTSDLAYYNYMQNIWTDGSHLTYGGNGYQSSALNTNYMFSGNPATGIGWSEVSAGDAFGDRRGLSSEGPFTFNPGADKSLDIALVFARAKTGNQNTSVTALGTAVQDVKTFYATQGYECDKTLTGINEVKQTTMATANFYPNPFSTSATLSVSSDKELTNAQLQVYDMLGREVYNQDNIHSNNITVEKGTMQTGLYFYRLSEDGQLLVNGKFMVY